MAEASDTVVLRAGAAEAHVRLRGAEPVSWRVGGTELLWHGDPAHWSYSAPILFPVVGASRDGHVEVDGRSYPMAQHGVVRVSAFREVERDAASVRLCLTDDASTRLAYPFAFRFEVAVRLRPERLELAFTVSNTGDRPMPYALGWHPAFVWPLSGPDRSGHRVVFAEPERAEVPEVAPGGLLARRTRPVPLHGRVLPLDPAMFAEALVFLRARSRALSFEAPDGSSLEMSVDGFPHLAVWSRPTAPFLSLESWTGHADWEDSCGDLTCRDSMLTLGPGEERRHAVTSTWRPAPPRPEPR